VTALVQLESVSRVFRSGELEVTALRDIDLQIHAGEFIAVIGPSGVGKSTLLNIIGCLDRPTSGRYFLQGLDATDLADAALAKIRNQTVSFVFQSFNLIPELTALENVELPLLYRARHRSSRALASSVLESIAPGIRAEQPAGLLSAGEQQRVAIARAVVANPRIILADEPTGSLDPANGATILRHLLSLHQRGATVILATHDPAVAQIAGRSFRLARGTRDRAA
jgi:putative ABC transport system ATP-binding protein